MIRVDDAGDVTKCWLSPDELSTLERSAGEGGWEREIAVQLIQRCGLRVSEVSYPGDDRLRYSKDGGAWLFEVRGKNTKGGDRKTRDAWMPDDVADDVRTAVSDNWTRLSRGLT